MSYAVSHSFHEFRDRTIIEPRDLRCQEKLSMQHVLMFVLNRVEMTFSSIASIGPYVEAVDNIVEGYRSACTATSVEPSDLSFLDRDIRDRVFEKLGKGKDRVQDPAGLMIISLMHSGSALNQK